ncbi:MAG: hypothetical protein HQK50_02625 [Oligoflexia bacterium]|nr:hypothetical protein [Oligoflexia bacterium]MBF0364435.1 hypothetical protein [Oligoflexia bacterium]
MSKYLALILGTSLLWHLLMFSLISNFESYIQFFKIKTDKLKHSTAPIAITSIPKEELFKLKQQKRMHTVGKDDGKKNIFTIPLQNKATPFIPPTKHKIVKSKPSQEIFKDNQATRTISLADLQTRLNEAEKTHLSPSTSAVSIPQLPRNLNLDIRVEVPEGVDLDKLNEIELKFYGFNLRVFRSYVSAIYHAYEDFKLASPHVNFAQMSRQSLLASVTYNVNGGIEHISFIRSASDDRLQAMFQRALENNSVQNPPKEIVENGRFQLRYELVVNP